MGLTDDGETWRYELVGFMTKLGCISVLGSLVYLGSECLRCNLWYAMVAVKEGTIANIEKLRTSGLVSFSLNPCPVRKLLDSLPTTTLV
jgi:hypothetical protein